MRPGDEVLEPSGAAAMNNSPLANAQQTAASDDTPKTEPDTGGDSGTA